MRIWLNINENLSYLKDILNVAQFDFNFGDFNAENSSIILNIVADNKITEENLLNAIKRYLNVKQKHENKISNVEMTTNTLTDYIKVNFN